MTLRRGPDGAPDAVEEARAATEAAAAVASAMHAPLRGGALAATLE